MGLTACGENKSRVYKKQRTPTAIKIDKLDLTSKNLSLRFNYRSYVEKTLENIQCDISFNKDITVKLVKSVSIQLGAFATEILYFDKINSQLTQLQNHTSIDYSLMCQISYNQGKEKIRQDSVLYLAPGEKFIYR